MLIAFFCYLLVIFFYFFSLIFVMPLSYYRYWAALYVEGNENEGMLILHYILLLSLPLFLGVVQFCRSILYYIVNVSCSYFTLDLFNLLFHVIKLKNLVEISKKNCSAIILLFFFDNPTIILKKILNLIFNVEQLLLLF